MEPRQFHFLLTQKVKTIAWNEIEFRPFSLIFYPKVQYVNLNECNFFLITVLKFN